MLMFMITDITDVMLMLMITIQYRDVNEYIMLMFMITDITDVMLMLMITVQYSSIAMNVNEM